MSRKRNNKNQQLSFKGFENQKVINSKGDEIPFKDLPKEIQNEHGMIMQNGLSEAIFGYNPGGIGSQITQVDTLFKNNRWYLISNMRQLLSEMYVEHGLVQTVVDVPVDDGFRGGVEIKTKQLDEQQIDDLYTTIEQEDDLITMAQAVKWNRLYGGAGVLILTDQPPDKPLNIKEINEKSKLEFRDVDMWELFWSKQSTSDYSLAIDSTDFDTEYFDYYGVRVHRSRVMLLKGIKAPSFIRPRLRGWGVSVIEALVKSINQFLKANELTFEVLDEFKIDIFKIKGFNQTLLSQNGAAKIQQRVQIANQQKNFQNAISMDAEDSYENKELTFAGISEVMTSIRMQIASDLRMPITKVFGISSAGFNSGEDDIENYNAMVESQVRAKVKFNVIQMIELRCQQMFGMIPDDLTISFKPLRILSATQEEEVKTSKYNRLLQARQAGEISSKEFKEACNREKLLPIQLEENDETYEVPNKGDENLPTPKAASSTISAPVAKNSINKSLEHPDIIPKVACVGIIYAGSNGNEILTGKRRDNGLWTFPGGHLENGESPEEGALRETYEESGILLRKSDLKALPKKVVTGRNGKQYEVYPFIAEVDTEIHGRTNLDCDSEVSIWRWVDVNESKHELQSVNRHAENDLILEYLFK